MTSPQGPSQTPAGWFPDPEGSGQQRYWDGSQWTQHYSGGAGAGASAHAQPAQPAQTQRGPLAPAPSAWWGVPALALLALIGAAGRWQTGSLAGQEIESANGLDGDGWIMLFFVAVAVVLLVVWRNNGQRVLAIVAGVMALIAAILPLIYIFDPKGSATGALVDAVDWSTGWGAWLGFLSCLALAALAFFLSSKQRRG